MGHDDHFSNPTQQLQYVALSTGLHAGKIVPVELLPNAPPLLVSNDCYLGSTGGVQHSRMVLQCAPTAESLPMQRISLATGSLSATVFVQAAGTVVKKVLREGEFLYAQTSSIVALTEGVLALPPVPGAVVAGGGLNYGAMPPHRGWGAKLHTCCLVKGPGTVYLSNTGRAVGVKGPEHLVFVKLFLCLFVLGMIGALAQLVAIEHDFDMRIV